MVACAVEVYDELAAKVTEARGRMLRLNVSGAFHTPWMEKAAEALKAYLANKPTRVPELPLYANATAQPYADDAAHLLSTQVCHPVRWQESVERMAEAGVDTFIEVGAGKTLSRPHPQDHPRRGHLQTWKSRRICKNFRRCAHERQDRLVTGGSRGIGRAIAMKLAQGRLRRGHPLRRPQGSGGRDGRAA